MPKTPISTNNKHSAQDSSQDLDKNNLSSDLHSDSPSADSTQATRPKRNFWPYGILLVILLGVVLISISIRISVKHPVVDDVPFFIKHDDMDSAINDLLESTKALQNDFDFFINANATPTNDEALRPYSPYMRPPHRDKATQNTSPTLHTKSLNTIFLRVIGKSSKPQNLRLQAFIQKIGNLEAQEIFIYNPKDSSYSSIKPPKKGAQIPIGELILQENTQSKDSKKEAIYASPFFMLELEGRWIVSLQISQNDDKDTKSDIVVLEKEFFALPNQSTNTDSETLQ